MDDQVDLLRLRCAHDLGEPDLWFRPDGYPHALALCIINSLASTGAHYTSVRNVVERYVVYRSEQGGAADTLLRTFNELGGAEGWAETTRNRKPTSTAKKALLKAEAIRMAATRLVGLGIDTTDDLRSATPELLEQAKKAWLVAGPKVRDHVDLLSDVGRRPRSQG